jgi:NADH-quinone oxidoreductase subunit N
VYALANIWMPDGEALVRLAPILALVATIVAVLIGALLVGRNWRMAGGLTMVGALVTAWLCLTRLTDPQGGWAGLAPEGAAPMLIVDAFSNFFILLLSVFLALVTGMWFLGQGADLPERDLRRRDAVEFFVLLVGSAFGMAMMVSTSNLLMIVLAVESASLPSYGLAGFRKKNRLAAEASLKYILFGAVTSAIMIYGASLLYGQYHTLDLAAIGREIGRDGQPTLLMGVALFAFCVGVAFKISAVPFHFWCPDVFEGASIEVTTWLSVVSKAAGLGLLLRILMVVAANVGDLAVLQSVAMAIGIMAALTCTVGNFSAFRQTNMKRLLAFSSVAHAGYMLMAASVLWQPAGDGAAVHPAFSVVVAYITVYLFMNLGAFGCVALVYWSTGSESIDAFNGLIRRNPLLACAMVVFLFSLVGLPPFAGFMAKLWLLYALMDAKLVWLILIAVFNTLISLYYYARVAYAMIFVDDGQPAVRAPAAGQLAALACAVAILLLGTIWAGWLKRFSDARATDLYAGRPPATPAVVVDVIDED